MQKVVEWEIVSLGVEWSDYFQGFGCGTTRFEMAACGIGNSEWEAGEDALEQIAMAGISIPAEMEAEIVALSRVDAVSAYLKRHGVTETQDAETPWFHVGIRYSVKGE